MSGCRSQYTLCRHQSRLRLDARRLMAGAGSERHRRGGAGQLSSTSQETVSTQGQDIVIQPVNPDVVYVPEYASPLRRSRR